MYRPTDQTSKKSIIIFDTTTHFHPLYSLTTVKISNFKNPRWRTAAIFKIVKSPYLGNGSTDLHEILTLSCFCCNDHSSCETHSLQAFSISYKQKRKRNVNDVSNKTSGPSNLTKGRIAAAHGRFSRIRQMAPVCTPSNTYFFGPHESTTQTASQSV